MILAFFDKFLLFFIILKKFIVIIQVFSTSGFRKPPLGFVHELLENFYGQWNSFQLFDITNFSNFLYLSIFFKLLEFFCQY